jgi:hypothetical protein
MSSAPSLVEVLAGYVVMRPSGCGLADWNPLERWKYLACTPMRWQDTASGQ